MIILPAGSEREAAKMAFGKDAESVSRPVVRPLMWSVTASDSSAGAGMQADVAVANQYGVQVACVVIAVTAQNAAGFQQYWPMPIDQIKAQWLALKEDGWPDVIRIGWLPDDDAIWNWLCEALIGVPSQVIWDPVVKPTRVGFAGSEHAILTEAAVLQRYRSLLHHVDIITPNAEEAAVLLGLAESLPADCLAQELTVLGPSTVIVTAGDVDSGSNDDALSVMGHGSNIVKTTVYHHASVAEDAPEQLGMPLFELHSERLDIQAHGTGCHFTAALAAGLANGERLYDAILKATQYAWSCLQRATTRRLGYHNCFATRLTDQSGSRVGVHVLPETASNTDSGADVQVQSQMQTQLQFPQLAKPLGLYGLVDNLQWLEKLLDLGVDTLQWRVKHQHDNYREDTARAIHLCEQAGVPLYINDDWQLAMELNAWGVHLGQEDLGSAHLIELAEAGICLGVSTHTEWEIARARSLKPSYIAFGPVFPPLSKRLKYPPLGLAKLKQWCRENSDFPLTCIGGITEQNVADVVASGMPSVAIVTALANDDGLPQRFEMIRRAFDGD